MMNAEFRVAPLGSSESTPDHHFLVVIGKSLTSPDRRKSQVSLNSCQLVKETEYRHGNSSTSIRQQDITRIGNENVSWPSLDLRIGNFQTVFDKTWPDLSEVDKVEKTANLVYSFELSGNGKLASFYVVYFVEQSFRKYEFEKINSLLSEIKVDSVTEWSMIALLRSSFSARNFLPAWKKFFYSVQENLINQGKDSKRLLRGLDR